MHIPPAFIVAMPANTYADIRDGLESAILRHGREQRPNRLTAVILQSLQGGFNEAIQREKLDIAPLALNIKNEVLT